MRRALELARRGEGAVEPNPMVGAVVVETSGRVVGEGFHERFGGPHAEVHALRQAGGAAQGATLYVTLEPCCHHGKTPPCTDAILASGIYRVVVAASDPFPQVAGGGIARLREPGLEVEVGLLEAEARALTAPFRQLVTTGRPWVHAKWAMTLDGKIATHTGASQWISNSLSRERVHRLRGCMDAILVGSGTAQKDNPLLTAWPSGPRVATRVVLDSTARLSAESKLVSTVNEAPVLLVCSHDAPAARVALLRNLGVEVLQTEEDGRPDLVWVLDELGRRSMTNVLIEGGGEILGACLDRERINEVHVFVAPKLLGGSTSPSPVAGLGHALVPDLPDLEEPIVELLGGDVYVHGRVRTARAGG